MKQVALAFYPVCCARIPLEEQYGAVRYGEGEFE
jgi:hypothetical protein